MIKHGRGRKRGKGGEEDGKPENLPRVEGGSGEEEARGANLVE